MSKNLAAKKQNKFNHLFWEYINKSAYLSKIISWVKCGEKFICSAFNLLPAGKPHLWLFRNFSKFDKMLDSTVY